MKKVKSRTILMAGVAISLLLPQAALATGGTYPVYKGMIGLVNIANDKRILAAHDAIGTGYDTGGQPHPTLAPDGKLVMWTSNMNNSGRFDTFVARVPVR